MIAFKLNGKPIQIASNWDDLTFDQYLKVIENQGGTVGILSIFTRIEPETLKKATITGLDTVIQSLSFLKTPPKWNGFTDKVGKYKLPSNKKGEFDIQLESLGQFEDMRAIMTAVPKDNIVAHIKSYSKYVSIYLQKIRDGEYDYNKALEMEFEVMQMNAREIIIAGSFFFLEVLSLSTGIPKTSLITSPSQKKIKPVSRNFKKSSAHTARSHKSRLK